MSSLDTANPYNYKYETESLEIHVLGGVRTNKLESLRGHYQSNASASSATKRTTF